MDEVRLIDANALHKRIEMNLRASNPFTIEECCYKDALNSVDDAPTIDPETLQPTWRNPETDPPKVETEVLILYRNDIDGYSITTAHYEDGSVFYKIAYGIGKIFRLGDIRRGTGRLQNPERLVGIPPFQPGRRLQQQDRPPRGSWMPLPPEEITK